MENRLVKGMYGSQFRPDSKLFGLTCGQMRGKEDFGHNSGWYNYKGEKIGWGDLDKKDVMKISKQLKDNEIFITMGEMESFWEFVEEFGIIGSMCKVNSKEREPGIDYLIQNARFIIVKDKIYKNDTYNKPGIGEWLNSGVEVEFIYYDRAKEIILEYLKKNEG